ncbi:DEAD/DEAH box helicase [Candidatus Pacearchaeota archaeon]|nr:DEAD/DEAH box helicase [Candidatus Pacearchaeota archaeon]
MDNIEKFLLNIKPREYQERIFQTCKDKNCLVVLPTGLGKTLIALMLAIDRLQRFPNSKVLFLAPTRPLAEQHFNYFKKHLPELFASFELFTGKVNAGKRRELWDKTDIIFSTPQCIANDLKNNLYNLENVSLLIEDECHRCLKSYDYVYVAEKNREQSKQPRMLGLTASPGSEASIIKDICKNLGIGVIEARTRESEDVGQYLQKLEIETVLVELPEEFKEIRNILQTIYEKKIEELRNRKILFAPATKKNLLELQGRIMRSIGSGNRNFNLLRASSVCAQAIKLQHALEMIETQGIGSLHNYLQDLFEQTRKGQSKAVIQLTKSKEFNQAYIKASELLAKQIEHPKLSKLIEIIEQEFKKGAKRIIVFSQYRNMATRICKEINKIGIKARVFIGQAMKDGQGLSQKEQQQIVKEFSLGLINVLCATSIGEEGLDLPEVNAVIFYEPIPSAIRKIQRAGRTARLKPGKLITLITRKTRDEAYHWAAYHKEKKMYSIIKNMNLKLEKKEKQKTLT